MGKLGRSSRCLGAFNGALLALSPSVSQIFLLLFFIRVAWVGKTKASGRALAFHCGELRLATTTWWTPNGMRGLMDT
jgi:hypothetical protein